MHSLNEYVCTRISEWVLTIFFFHILCSQNNQHNTGKTKKNIKNWIWRRMKKKEKKMCTSRQWRHVTTLIQMCFCFNCGLFFVCCYKQFLFTAMSCARFIICFFFFYRRSNIEIYNELHKVFLMLLTAEHFFLFLCAVSCHNTAATPWNQEKK